MTVTLRELLIRNKEALVEHWRQRIVEAYHTDSHEFMLGESDRFQNPVGHVIREETEILFQQLVEGINDEVTSTSLEKLIRIRAVQDMAPSEATAFVFMLKPLIRQLLKAESESQVGPDELHDVECAVDRMALMAFDQYTVCRERVSEIKVNDARRQTAKLIERLNAGQADATDEGITDKEI
jgi:hypothetical protein